MSVCISPQEFKKILEKKDGSYVLLDVREPFEYEIVNVGGLNIPLSTLQSACSTLDTNKKYITLCHHGVRSRKAQEFLASQGYHCLSLEGGLDKYSLEVDPRLRRY